MGQFRTVWYKILCYNGRVKEDGSGLSFVYEFFPLNGFFAGCQTSLSCTECSPCPAKSHWYPAYANRLLKVGAQCRTMSHDAQVNTWKEFCQGLFYKSAYSPCKSVKHRLHFSEVECSHGKGGDLRSKYYPTLTAKNP